MSYLIKKDVLLVLLYITTLNLEWSHNNDDFYYYQDINSLD